jgi:hypothetical protein
LLILAEQVSLQDLNAIYKDWALSECIVQCYM